MAKAQDTQRVRAITPERSLVTFDIEVVLRGPFKLLTPLLKLRFRKTMSGLLGDLREYVEKAG